LSCEDKQLLEGDEFSVTASVMDPVEEDRPEYVRLMLEENEEVSDGTYELDDADDWPEGK
jgi:hypothetical protein